MVFQKLAQLGLFSLAFVAMIASVFAWPAYVPDTWNSNQVYAGSFYTPTSPYSGWTYNAYVPSNGYPALGGGRFYPRGYNSGSYLVNMRGFANSYLYGNFYSGYPYASTFDFSIGAPVHYSSDSYYGSYGSCYSYYGC